MAFCCQHNLKYPTLATWLQKRATVADPALPRFAEVAVDLPVRVSRQGLTWDQRAGYLYDPAGRFAGVNELIAGTISHRYSFAAQLGLLQ